MKKTTTPTIKDLVLIGGGHAHLSVLRRFAMQPLPGLRITLISNTVHTPYSGRIPGYLAGHYRYDDSHIDLRPLAQAAEARLYSTQVTGLDPKHKIIQTQDRPPIPYDLVSINIGSTPNIAGITGDTTRIIPIKPIEHFIGRWQTVMDQLKTNTQPTQLVIVGGGAGGVELLLAIQHHIQQHMEIATTEHIHYQLITQEASLLAGYPASVQNRIQALFNTRQIRYHTKAEVIAIEDQYLITAEGQQYPADIVLWATQASAPDWLQQTGLATDAQGFIQVHNSLQSHSHPNIFAAGDIAALDIACPKSGVYAVRQGPILADNLRRAATGRKLRQYRRQTQQLNIISTGNQYAIATRGRWTLAGKWLWQYKDWIDQQFMQRYNRLPRMPEPSAPKLAKGLADNATQTELSGLRIRCGGCGAKVGSTVLNRVLQRLPSARHPDVILGPEQADDAALLQIPADHIMVQSVDYFRAFIDDPYIFGAIAANHALGDLYAMGAKPQSALAIATLPYDRETIVEQTLYELMAGATEMIHASGAVVAGGHTSEGAELAFGLTVNGTLPKHTVLSKSGLQLGDQLILNKPLGTGTLLAADMRGQAKGRWITEAIQHMLHSNQAAAQIVQQHQAHACTDITGFGLLGHLHEMMQASQQSVQLQLEALPVMHGACETLAAGIQSSLQPANMQHQRVIQHLIHMTQHPLYPILFDPQTAGGILTAIPADQAETCIIALQNAGYPDSRIIGQVIPLTGTTPHITLDATH